MFTYILKQLNSGNIKLSKILNAKEIGSIIGRVENQKGFICNINVNQEHRRNKHGSEILNMYENLVKYNYNVNEIHLAAWENIRNPFSVTNFYVSNGYISKNKKSTYYDDKIDIFEINQYYKTL